MMRRRAEQSRSTAMTRQDLRRSIALPPPSRRLRGRLRCAAFSRSATPAQAPRRLPLAIRGRLRCAFRSDRTARLLPRVCAHPAAQRAHLLPSKRTDAGATLRLRLRYRLRPPSPLAQRVHALHEVCRVRSRGSGGPSHIMWDYTQCRRWPRSTVGANIAAQRAAHHRHCALAGVESHRRTPACARRVINIMSTARSASLRLRCAPLLRRGAGCPCRWRARPCARSSARVHARARTGLASPATSRPRT